MGEKIYGLLGRRLGHSWSVPIHTALGCPAYRLIEREPEELSDFLRREDIGGLNVTIPYKREVLSFCDEVDGSARAIGSANTLVRRGGKLIAFNTDGIGFCAMAERAGISLAGRKVVVLGSGGASLTAVACARQLGAGEVVVISRSGKDNYQNLDRHSDGEILVNTTPVGMYPDNGKAPVDLSAFPVCRGVLDLIYNPHRTALLLQAQERNIPCSDGLPMLTAQAGAAEEIFFDKPIPHGEIEKILTRLRRETENLVLIGMPGCGKSTVGKALARLTGREAVDLDQWVEEKAGCSVPRLIETCGEQVFRDWEQKAAEACGRQTGKILMTGGGIVTRPDNYAPLKQNGRIYHLIRELYRLPTRGRPLSQGKDLSRLWEERAPFYARFRDQTVENNGTAEETAAAIWRDFCAYTGDERSQYEPSGHSAAGGLRQDHL